MLTVLFNILSAVLNIFSFAAIIPILNILFRTEESLRQVEYMPITMGNLKEALMNNMNYYMQELILDWGSHDDAAGHRPVSGFCHLPEDVSLLPFFGHDYTDSYGRGA